MPSRPARRVRLALSTCSGVGVQTKSDTGRSVRVTVRAECRGFSNLPGVKARIFTPENRKWWTLAAGAASLIAARTVQGIGAAMMNPATLSIITATFPPRQRGTAIGIWAGVAALALAIGPLVGGILTQDISWSWIFFINIPVGVIGVLAARIFIDETSDTSRVQRLDLPGLVT